MHWPKFFATFQKNTVPTMDMWHSRPRLCVLETSLAHMKDVVNSEAPMKVRQTYVAQA
jgi:hypothetical protein